MTKRKASKKQAIAIPKEKSYNQISFNLNAQDSFVKSHGVSFIHYRAMPSPIGLKDRGEYRRSDSLDTIAENGFIYKKCGEFTGVILNNQKSKKPVDGGLYDTSEARLTLPRFYNEDSSEAANERIHLCPGDRIFLKNVDKEEKSVVNYQRVQYNPNGSDFLQFPALCVESIVDSLGREYKEGIHFKITKGKIDFGNIKWIKGRKNPGIDPDTGKGRVYSIRYRYEAHWYVTAILNELRIGRVTDNQERKETRMPYQVLIQREYVYHQRNRGDSQNSNNENEVTRTKPEPEESIDPNKYEVKVNINSFE